MEYFGKGCEWFTGQWASVHGKRFGNTPIFVFCNHPANKRSTEGNCNKLDCPLKKKKSDFK